MLRRTAPSLAFRASPMLRVWTAEEGDANIPETTFKNVKPTPLIRLWRQIRQNVWTLFTIDEALTNPQQESYQHQHRMEQICFLPLSAYGSVPGSYADPLLYNTKTTSPFRWHVQQNSSDIVGHWYIEFDDIQRIKEWQPKDPNDPFEMFPRPPQIKLDFEEQVDEHGNRNFRYKYKYDIMSPYMNSEPHQKYPTSHHYFDDQRGGKVEPYGFKQGELLRCNEEEEKVLRRVMEEEDREWEMVKRTELVQEPHTYPGKIRSEDFKGAVDRAKKRFRDQIREGKETNPELDPDFDLVKSGEFAEPQDGPRASWRHLWQSERKGGPHAPTPYESHGNFGNHFDDNVPEEHPPLHPDQHYETKPRPAPTFDLDPDDKKH